MVALLLTLIAGLALGILALVVIGVAIVAAYEVACAAGRFLMPAVINKLPGGTVASIDAAYGLFALMSNVNAFSPTYVAYDTAAATTGSISVTHLLDGIIARAGTPAGGVTDTTDTAANIIAAFGPTIPVDGTFYKPIRLINSTGQTITLAGGSGVTVTGTATIADGAYRDFILRIASSTTVTLTNIGGGTL